MPAAERAPFEMLFAGPPPYKTGPHKKGGKKEVAEACRLKGPVPHLVVQWEGEGQSREPIVFACQFLRPLKFVLGLSNLKIYATKGPLRIAADRALFLKSASVFKWLF